MDAPNILWICTDQQRYDSVGCYGNEMVDTPAIDSLAETGVQFDRCFAQSPVCTPSRASMLTGRYPRTTGVRQNGQAIPDNEVLVTRLLADQGYNCGLAGKLHIAPSDPADDEHVPMMERRADDGFAEFHWSHDPREIIWGERGPANAYHQWLDQQGIEYDVSPSPHSEYIRAGMPADAHHTRWTAEMAQSFLRRNASADRPWTFLVNFFDPHVPFDPPTTYLERYLDRLDEIPLPIRDEETDDTKPIFHQYPPSADRFPFEAMDEDDHCLVKAAYFAMIDLLDDAIADILETLAETGQRENTIIVFTSDHGEMLGDHGIYLKGPYFYEPAIRVPLIIVWPETFRTGDVSDALVELVDLAPTLLKSVGIEIPSRMQGRSLVPLLTGGREDRDHRDMVYAEYYHALEREQFYNELQDQWAGAPETDQSWARKLFNADVFPRFQAGAADSETMTLPYATMVRTDRYKLIRHHSIRETELYDLETDPEERANRATDTDYRDVRMEMLGRLTDTMAKTIDPDPPRKGRY